MWSWCIKRYLERKIQEFHLTNKVKLLGYRSDVIEILKKADLFIFPSKREGLPVSVIEAMAAGLPVIASNVRGNRDLIEKENLFEPNECKNINKFNCKNGLMLWRTMNLERNLYKFRAIFVDKCIKANGGDL